MKKVIILIVSLLTVGLGISVDLSKYFSPKEIKIINTYLTNYHKKLQILPIKNQCQKYNKIIEKINSIERKKFPVKIAVLIEYIKEQVTNWSKICKITNPKKNFDKKTNSSVNESTKKTQTKKIEKTKINSNYLKRDSILVPISWTAYTIYGINIKPIYGDVIVKSLLFRNIYGSTADPVVKKCYLISITWQTLATSSLNNWHIYFELSKPIRLLKDIYTPFYVAVSLNKVNQDTTNRSIKLKLEKQFGTLKTSIISADNWEEIWNWLWHPFASNTYIIRNSKLLLKNYYTRRNLRNWFRQIYSLNINSTWWKSILKSIILNTYLYKTSLDTWSFLLKINNLRYKNVKFDFSWENYVWNWKLKIIFWWNWYDILTGIKLDIYANFKNTKDHAKALFRLKDISNYTWIVNQNYTGNYSILWSDNTFKNWQYNYFTDAFLYFWNVHDWYLKKN